MTDRIIHIESGEDISRAEIQEAAAKHSVFLQESVWQAFRSAQKKDYEKAVELCRKILASEAHLEVRMLLGTCYFMQGHMEMARMVFAELALDYPEEEEILVYLGMTDHALERFEEAVRELGSIYPLDEYRPFYYSSYADSLQQTGRLKQARDVFYEEVSFFKLTGTVVSAVMLDGVFQNLLFLDATLGNGHYPEDVKIYYDFLDQVEMTEEMRECLAGNIIYFCSLMSNKWYRPLFLEFITHIRDRGFLAGGKFQSTLDSAFSSWESYGYHEDRQISAVMEDYLAAAHENRYGLGDAVLEEDKTMIKIKALSYEWYMCQYLPEHPDEADYVRDTYPHACAGSEEFFEKARNDAKGTADRVLDELLPYSHGMSRQELEESLHKAYKRVFEIKKEPAYVYDGEETYRRIQPKIGRNDPCPCGSGKKYKKCCGK